MSTEMKKILACKKCNDTLGCEDSINQNIDDGIDFFCQCGEKFTLTLMVFGEECSYICEEALSAKDYGGYHALLRSLKLRLIERLKIVEPTDTDEFSDDTMSIAISYIDIFFEDEIFDIKEKT